MRKEENLMEWENQYRTLILNGNEKAAKEVLLENISQDTIIYKYCGGLNRDFKTFSENKIWMSNAWEFNDPYDSAFLVNKHRKENYDPKTERDIALKDYKEQRKQDIESMKLQKKMFISCFSERCDSILMWSHYAREHRGLCIGYNLYELIKTYDCFPVIYENAMFQIKGELEDSILQGTLWKCNEWQYEKEWRILKKDETKEGNKGFVQDFLQPVEIYFGCREWRTIEDNRQRQRFLENQEEILLGDNYYVDINRVFDYAKEKEIKLFSMELSRKKYSLERVRIVY